MKGPAKTTVTLRHAEILDQKGNLYTANLRGADQTDRYTLRGDEAGEVFEPRFTFHGFRYVALSGYPGTPTLDTLTGIVVHSDVARTGRFETSNGRLNRLQQNIVWSQRGNFLDVPTDCPQRDERLGWTGDAQVFARTAAFNMGVAGFFTKWLRDLASDQRLSGAVPHVVPDALGGDGDANAGAVGWGDAAVVVPWTVYRVYGDRRVLAEQYPSMKAWVDYGLGQAGPGLIWRTGSQFGDWLSYRGEDANMAEPVTDPDFLATAYLAHSAGLLARAARVIGRAEEASRYEALVGSIRRAFQREFVTEAGRVGDDTQTAYVLALAFGLLPASARGRGGVAAGDRHRAAQDAPDDRFPGNARARARPDAIRAPRRGLCRCSTRTPTRRGSTRSRGAPPRSGSAGTGSGRRARSRIRG